MCVCVPIYSHGGHSHILVRTSACVGIVKGHNLEAKRMMKSCLPPRSQTPSPTRWLTELGKRLAAAAPTHNSWQYHGMVLMWFSADERSKTMTIKRLKCLSGI